MSDQYLHFAEGHKSRASKLPYVSALAILADSGTYFQQVIVCLLSSSDSSEENHGDA